MCRGSDGSDEGLDADTTSCFSSVMYTEGATAANQKLMALPKDAARFASLKASDTVWGWGGGARRRGRRKAEFSFQPECDFTEKIYSCR